MRLYNNDPGFAARLIAGARPTISIRSGVAGSLPALPYWRELIKLKARSLVYPGHTRRWLQLLNSHPSFSEYVQAYPRMLYKIYRPYLTTALSMEARLAVLASHYQFVFARGLDELVGQASRRPVTLARYEGKGTATYEVALRAIGPLEREGELVLQLWRDDKLLYSVAFTFAWRGEAYALNIGCIQGARCATTRDAIRTATRELHGMRPKQLLIALTRQLGWQVGCRDLRMVSNANRVVRSALRKGRVLADYDAVWTELGAARQADGDFLLPCAPLAAPDLESIPSRKRSEARKRHEMMAAMAAALNARLAALPAEESARQTRAG